MHELRPVYLDMDGVYASGHVDWCDGAAMRVELPSLGRAWTVGAAVRAEVLDDVRGRCVYDGTVTEREDLALVLSGLVRVATFQDREAVRVGVHEVVAATVQAAAPKRSGTAGSDTAKSEEAGSDAAGADEVKVTLLDLSAHGLRLIAPRRLEVGDTLDLAVPHVEQAGGVREVPVRVVVVRTQQMNDVVHYGCRFVGHDAARTELLSRHVARLQREELRRRASY
ncbi:PilZ domain-containing protein [Puerhibacterium puerhi]|uniref:PilZ domain-containing protein n=1 Tax=Puerhibacterium puerhi TaxID=2692623 RepID=UPI001359F5C5|nr:PilZ domain-containing protein [Puerhibacterium puerhi]